MGKFHLVYYISMGTPSIEASLQMAETYLAHGVSALQFDLPSRNPYRETLFIRKRMTKAWETYGGYEPFLTALTEFRRKHPDFEMQMVSYEDVIPSALHGTSSFASRTTLKPAAFPATA